MEGKFLPKVWFLCKALTVGGRAKDGLECNHKHVVCAFELGWARQGELGQKDKGSVSLITGRPLEDDRQESWAKTTAALIENIVWATWAWD